MSKRATSSAILVLLAASGAWAWGIGAIGQAQNADIGLVSHIQLFGGYQTVGSIQNLAIRRDQGPTRAWNTEATQLLVGNFAQIGSASASDAVVGVLQELAAVGEQAQLVKAGHGPKAQGQSLDLSATQGLSKIGGAGAGHALQQIVVNEEQRAVNPRGIMEQRSMVLGLQESDVTGGAPSGGTVSSSMSVHSTQSQATW